MATIGYLTTTVFDFGAIKSLPTELEALGIRRPLLVTDAGVQSAGIAAQVLSHLDPTTVVGIRRHAAQSDGGSST